MHRAARLARKAAPVVVSSVVSAASVLVLREYVVDVTACKGPSMLPTLREQGDYVLALKATVFAPPRTGDVVIARSPTDGKQLIVKRIMAMPGELMSPEFRTPVGPRRGRTFAVPDGFVWLQGDNATNSVDSRTYGLVPIENVRAMVVGRVLPRDLAGRVERRVDLAAAAGNRSVSL